MQRFSDEEIVGRFIPRGLSPPIAEGEQVPCARLRCGRADRTPGARAYRWAPRQAKGPSIELCARCHKELVTILSGG
ncbi:MAG: hypothetical protein ABI186_01230 [Candidatus Elarobacter sp.]